MRVVEINVGIIPPRTKVTFDIPINKDKAVDTSTLPKQYTCMDCGFKTEDVEAMLEHQTNQRKYHTWLQRLKRWWYL